MATLLIAIFGCAYHYKNQSFLTNLREANNMHEIHDVVVKEGVISYCNFEIVQILVKEYGCPQDTERMEEYQKFLEQHTIIMYNNRIRCGKSLHDTKKVVFKVEHNLIQGIDGTIITLMKQKIASYLKNVRESSLYLKSVRTGCLEFEFLVPDLIYDLISKLSAENKRKMFKEEISFIQLFGYDSSDNMVSKVHE